MKLRIPLNSGDMQPKDVKVTIRGRGELLLIKVETQRHGTFRGGACCISRCGNASYCALQSTIKIPGEDGITPDHRQECPESKKRTKRQRLSTPLAPYK